MIHERRYYFILYRKTNDISSYTIDDRQRLRRLGPAVRPEPRSHRANRRLKRRSKLVSDPPLSFFPKAVRVDELLDASFDRIQLLVATLRINKRFYD